MFLIFEHTLAARRVLASKEQTLFHFAEEGIVNHEDTEFLVRKVLEPRLHLMESFVPSEDLLFRLSECGNENSGLQKGSLKRRRGTVIGRMKQTIGLRDDVNMDIVRRIRESRFREFGGVTATNRRPTRVHSAVQLRNKQARAFNLVRSTARLGFNLVHRAKTQAASESGQDEASESYFAEMEQTLWAEKKQASKEKNKGPQRSYTTPTACTSSQDLLDDSVGNSLPPPCAHPDGAAFDGPSPNGTSSKKCGKVGFALPNAVE
jgi:hypothetical protein